MRELVGAVLLNLFGLFPWKTSAWFVQLQWRIWPSKQIWSPSTFLFIMRNVRCLSESCSVLSVYSASMVFAFPPLRKVPACGVYRPLFSGRCYHPLLSSHIAPTQRSKGDLPHARRNVWGKVWHDFKRIVQQLWRLDGEGKIQEKKNCVTESFIVFHCFSFLWSDKKRTYLFFLLCFRLKFWKMKSDELYFFWEQVITQMFRFSLSLWPRVR